MSAPPDTRTGTRPDTAGTRPDTRGGIRTPRFVVVAGQSGAGRRLAAGELEDLGWFVVDNLPPELVPGVIDLAGSPGRPADRVALVAGSGRYQRRILPALDRLRASKAPVSVLFLEAAAETLVRRYHETRRRHPMAAGGSGGAAGDGGERLLAAIDREARLLAPVRSAADIVLDTSGLNKHELRRAVARLFTPDGADGPGDLPVTLVSFGFKHGLPPDADLVFDCRFLPNPHWVERLRPGTGLDRDVRDYVLGQRTAGAFLDHLAAMLGHLLPAFAAERRTCLTVALGCTGGRHRSVAMVEQAAARIRDLGYRPAISHRDVNR